MDGVPILNKQHEAGTYQRSRRFRQARLVRGTSRAILNADQLNVRMHSIDAASIVGRSQLVTSRFGRWPSFHDAEIVEFILNRGSLHLREGVPVLPFASVTIHHWRLTSEADAKGYFVLDLHTVSTLRFNGISELKMDEFNQQNAIYSLRIEKRELPSEDMYPIKVEFESSFGMGASFRCMSVEVVESHESNEKGIVHPNQSLDSTLSSVTSRAGHDPRLP